ncbi:hypothetical protein MP228_000029 [Amoeboaphelidium protococcarum]|nr:hypothetical protein MP228_000029 [Amoeboaphelidium protococcarum]
MIAIIQTITIAIMLFQVLAIPGIRWSRPERSTQPIAATYPEYMTTMERIKQLGMCTFCKDRVPTTTTTDDDDDDQFDTYFDAIENFDVEDYEMGRVKDLTLDTTEQSDQYEHEAQQLVEPYQDEPTRQLGQEYTRDGIKSSLKSTPSLKEWLRMAQPDLDEKLRLSQASRLRN